VKADSPWPGGSTLVVLGAMAFFPPLFDFEFLLTAWLGPMQQPAGLSAMVVGGGLFVFGKLRELRDAPVMSPTDLAGVVVSNAGAREAIDTTDSAIREPAR
jgi:hypothetical protein